MCGAASVVLMAPANENLSKPLNQETLWEVYETSGGRVADRNHKRLEFFVAIKYRVLFFSS